MVSPDLTIVVPVLDWDISLLVSALVNEIHGQGLEERVRILIGDDGSSPPVLAANRAAVAGVGFITLIENAVRLGRAANRNRLLERVPEGLVLFLDADMLPDSDMFLTTYLRERERGGPVLCGGYSYRTRILSGRRYDLYLYKGKKTEWLPADRRQRHPWRYLFTGNVLVDREVLARVPFDESFTGYGYEDIEWGIRLEREVGIRHIDNPCSHLGLVDKEEALERMKRSLVNYLHLRRRHPREFGATGVSAPLSVLVRLPLPLLERLDRMLSVLYGALSWPRGAFLCFQLDKAVGLAILMRRQERGRR